MSSDLPGLRKAPSGIADPALRRDLADMIRGRVPAAEVDDLVQATLAEALAAASPPEEGEALRKWVFGIARHTVADFYRRSRREQPGAVPELEAPAAPHSARDLERWVERALPQGDGSEKTVEWMMREGDGEKLETIAKDENVPAPRVRQRVSRLRRILKARWAAELAAVATLAALALVYALLWRRGADAPPHEIVPDIAHVPAVDPKLERGRELRRAALERCASFEAQPCLDGLDAAAALDPDGDRAEDVTRARAAARDALAPKPAPSSSSAPAPSSSSAPAPVPTSTLPKAPAHSSMDSMPATTLGGSSKPPRAGHQK